jgi:hypothetical protein
LGLVVEEITHGFGGRVWLDESGAYGAREDEGELAGLGFFVGRDELQKLRRIERRAGKFAEIGDEAGGVEMARDALGVVARAEFEIGGKFEGEADAGGDGFAVEQIGGVAAMRFERVREGVAEIEQSAFALLRLVAGDDGGFEGDGCADGVAQRIGITGDDVARVAFAPREELGVSN